LPASGKESSHTKTWKSVLQQTKSNKCCYGWRDKHNDHFGVQGNPSHEQMPIDIAVGVPVKFITFLGGLECIWHSWTKLCMTYIQINVSESAFMADAWRRWETYGCRARLLLEWLYSVPSPCVFSHPNLSATDVQTLEVYSRE
jgi:hypothetical protein